MDQVAGSVNRTKKTLMSSPLEAKSQDLRVYQGLSMYFYVGGPGLNVALQGYLGSDK